MNDFEKVEKLRERANVSYEEAKKALEEANGDILDAMIILENQGKTDKPNNSSYTTKYEDSTGMVPVAAAKDESKSKTGSGTKEKANELGRKFREFLKKLNVNYLIVERKEERIIKIPLWAFILIVILAIQIVPILIVISLFFGFKYSFEGEDEMKAANDAAKKVEEVAGEVVDVVKEGLDKHE